LHSTAVFCNTAPFTNHYCNHNGNNRVGATCYDTNYLRLSK
jgi:hypothetical protein